MKPWKIVLIVVGSIVGAGALLCCLLVFVGSRFVPTSSGFPQTAGENVAVLHIHGTISSESDGEYNHQWLMDSLDYIIHDTRNSALLLEVDSPGGSVYECDEIYLKILEYQETGRPVYTSMSTYAASGGYYISAPSEKIFANRNTITGSIGVAFSTLIDVTPLLDKYGIRVKNITSGANKAMGSATSPYTQEQVDILQSVADEAYEQFVQIVAEGRNLSNAYVKSIADGRIYTAKQALDNKLVDGIATLEEVKERMCEDLDFDPEFVDYTYTPSPGLLDYLRLQLGLDGSSAQSDLAVVRKLMEEGVSPPQYLAPIG